MLQGFYGAVYLGEIVRSDGSKEHIAIKKMKDKKEQIVDNTDMDFIREFEILQVKYLEPFSSPPHPHVKGLLLKWPIN